jgi:IS30 family transposase
MPPAYEGLRQAQPDYRSEAPARRESGEPVTEIARSYNVAHSTISRLATQTGTSDIL